MNTISSKPRVAYILQMFGIGGMPKWLFRLASELQDEFEFSFIATNSPHFAKEYKKVAKLYYFPYKSPFLQYFLKWKGFDIIQTANKRMYVDAAINAGTKVIIERTDGIRAGAALGDKSGLDAVIASTRGLVPILENMIAKERIHLIFNGIDSEKYQNITANRFGFSDKDIIIGRVSRMTFGKNISLLIQSVIELRQDPKYDHVRLVICGGDNTEPQSQPALARYKTEAKPLGDSVIFTGEVFDTDPIVLGFDIGTCTSNPDNEGIPNSLLEAMAAGKPIVSTDVGNISEIVIPNKNGYLTPPGDVPALTAALKQLIDSKSMREEFGKTSLEIIRKDFDIKLQSSKYRELYHDLLKEKTSFEFK